MKLKHFSPIFLKNVFDSLGIGQSANSAYNKLFANLPDHQKTIAQNLNGKILFDPNPWYQNIKPPEFLKEIAKAIFEKNEIIINYSSWKKISKKQMIPLGLVLKSADWYLIGQTDKVLIYKVENILNLERTNQNFSQTNDFNIEEFWQKSIVRFEKQLRPLFVKIEIDEIALKNIEKLGDFAQNACDNKIYNNKTNRYIIDLPYENEVQIIHQILSISGEIKIIEPVELKEKFIEKILQIQNLNKY